MAINPDTGEYTGNDLERLEEALDKFPLPRPRICDLAQVTHPGF